MKNFIDLEIKHFDSDDFSFDLHPSDPNNYYYLRYRYFIPDDMGVESEYWFPTLISLITYLIQLLCRYQLRMLKDYITYETHPKNV